MSCSVDPFFLIGHQPARKNSVLVPLLAALVHMTKPSSVVFVQKLENLFGQLDLLFCTKIDHNKFMTNWCKQYRTNIELCLFSQFGAHPGRICSVTIISCGDPSQTTLNNSSFYFCTLQIERCKESGLNYTDLGGKHLYGKKVCPPKVSFLGSLARSLAHWHQPKKFDG